jgi:hypothetical protein
VIAAKAEVHSCLQACAFPPAHLDVGDDVVAHKHSISVRRPMPEAQRPHASTTIVEAWFSGCLPHQK